jgi:hypothetical protein
MGMGPIPPGTQALVGGRTEVWHYGGDANGNLGYWALDSVAFTDAWSQGDSSLQKAFTTLYGDHPVQAVSKNMGGDSGQSVGLTLAGQQKLQIIPAPEPEDNTPQTGPMGGVYNPAIFKATSPPPLYNEDAVWFDPSFGWTTDPGNIKEEPDFFDRLVPVALGVAAGFATSGLLASWGYAASTTVNVVGQAVVSSATTQLVGSGK